MERLGLGLKGDFYCRQFFRLIQVHYNLLHSTVSHSTCITETQITTLLQYALKFVERS